MKKQQENHKLAPDRHVLRTQVVGDLGQLLARWWLDRQAKERQRPCKGTASPQTK